MTQVLRVSSLPQLHPAPAVQDNFLDVSEEVRASVASHLRGAPTPFLLATDKDTASDDDQAAPAHTKRGLGSDKLHTAHTLVSKMITWPHKVVYTSYHDIKQY